MRSTNDIHATAILTLADLAGDPAAAIRAAAERAVALGDNGRPVAYLISADAYEALLERLDDVELSAMARTRDDGDVVTVSLDDL